MFNHKYVKNLQLKIDKAVKQNYEFTLETVYGTFLEFNDQNSNKFRIKKSFL